MTAWVLILYLGTNASMTVPGIESEQECKMLIDKISKEKPWLSRLESNAVCISYRAAYRF